MTLSPQRPPVTQASAWHFPTPTQCTLPSGMRVWRYDLPGQRLAAAKLVFDVPLSVEPREREGIGYLLARTLDEGTQVRSAEDFAEATERHGASYHARVSFSGIRTGISVPSGALPPALGLLAEAAALPAFPVDEVERAVRNRLDDITDERSRPQRRAWLELCAALFAEDCRLARPDCGSAETIAGTAPEDLRAFYAARIAPERATLVVAGDFSGIDVDSAVSEAFASWPSAATQPACPIEPIPAAGSKVVVVHRPGAVQTYLQFGTPAIDRGEPEWAALRVACHALGGTITSRLDALLREDKGYTYGMRSALRPYRRGSLLTINGSVHTEVTGESVRMVRGVIDDLLAGGVSGEECTTAVDYLLGVTPLQFQTAGAVADRAADLVHAGLGQDGVDAERAKLAEVTADQAAPALGAQLGSQGLSLVAVGDASSIVDPLRGSYGSDAVEVIDPETQHA